MTVKYECGKSAGPGMRESDAGYEVLIGEEEAYTGPRARRPKAAPAAQLLRADFERSRGGGGHLEPPSKS